MADPLSLAGTAVSVVSLGIQVFSGLYHYFRAVHGRSKELATVSQQIQHLVDAFQALKSIIPKIQALPHHDSTAITNLKRCIESMNEHIQAVQKFLPSQQNDDSSASDIMDR